MDIEDKKNLEDPENDDFAFTRETEKIIKANYRILNFEISGMNANNKF